MADKIQIYAGNKATMPQLLPREFGFCKDTNELYIGNALGTANILVGSVAWGSKISTLETAVTGLEGDISNLETAGTSMQGSITSLETRVSALEDRVSALEGTTP